MGTVPSALLRSQEVLGDAGAWALYPAQLWPALADPGRRSKHLVPRDEDPLEWQVEYWAPLVAMTFGALGWGRPDVGIARWMADGMPGDDGVLDQVLRWYGRRAAGLVAWSRASSALAEQSAALSDRLGVHLPAGRVPVAASTEAFPALTRGGGDPLQLSRVVDHLVAPSEDRGALFTSPGGDAAAVLLLDRHAGWYRTLHTLGSELAPSADGRPWSVDVVVRSIGSLGVYRRSQLTGRWFTGSEAVHMLGWPSLR